MVPIASRNTSKHTSYDSVFISSLSFGSSGHNFDNNQKSTPVLIYCTEENESAYDWVTGITDLTVKAALPGSGSQKILYSQACRSEISEFIEMSLNPDRATQEENPQE